ncbi:uncharacterized protein LOC122389306 [Amphibalanus amphitrite]|uniref:uncharacterized protein LOC122389306 n=1 Tax=Amphibalanus amphitrite TaxID=1232801 RepID=UPI001C92AFB9|nr:uncharacterized protein LOC122389306 [Amphibalanus amphitrite]
MLRLVFLSAFVLLGRVRSDPTTMAPPAGGWYSSGAELRTPGVAAAVASAADGLDGSAKEQDVTVQQLMAALVGVSQSGDRSVAAERMNTIEETLATIQTGLAAVSSRLEVIQNSQRDQLQLHTNLEKRLDTIERSQAETIERFDRMTQQCNTSSSGTSGDSLTQLQSEVSNGFDAVQGALRPLDGLQDWQNATVSRLDTLAKSQSALSTAVESGQDRAEGSRAAFFGRLVATVHQAAPASLQLSAIKDAVDLIPKLVVGQQCGLESDCSRMMPETRCSSTGVCTCRDGYRQTSDGRCQQHARLDEPCVENVDCQTLVPNAVCASSRCSCSTGFWNYQNKECRRVSTVDKDGPCVDDRECRSNSGLRCASGTCSCITKTTQNYEYRLFGGADCTEGNIQLRPSGERWGVVCDDEWDVRDASVVCRTLGFGSGLPTKKSTFGNGTGLKFYMDDVSCSGSESHLLACDYLGWGAHNCGSAELAGVRCGA